MAYCSMFVGKCAQALALVPQSSDISR